MASPVVITADTAAAGVILASLNNWLPPMAALMAIIWYGVQIYSSKPVQTWVRLQRIKRLRRRLARKASS